MPLSEKLKKTYDRQRRSKRNRTMAEYQSSDELDKHLESGVMRIVMEALLEGAGVFADQASENLKQHDSQQTGTAYLQSESAKDEDRRPPLYELVEINPTEGGFVIELEASVVGLGAILEHGSRASYWGNDPITAPSQRQGSRWMSDAYYSAVDKAAEAIEREVHKRLGDE